MKSPLTASLLCLAGCPAFADSGAPLEPVASSNWVPSLTSSIDGAWGLSGTDGGDSLHGIVLGGLAWTQPTDGWRGLGWSAYASVLGVEGQGPTARFLADDLGASNSEAHESLRLFEWWAEASKGSWALRVGALLADCEFACTTPGAALINSGFGWPAFISADTLNTGPAYYAAALGARLALTGATSTWKLGVYDGDSFDSAAGDARPNRHGTHYELGGSQGAFIIGEYTLAPDASPWRYQAGAWAHTANFADLSGGPAHTGNYGGYGTLERTLAGTPGEAGNTEAHLRLGFAPADRNAINRSIDAAVSAQGLLAGRPEDTVALGIVHAGRPDQLAGLDYEQVYELSYTAVINRRLSIQPDLQYIRHPASDPSRRDACLCLLRVTAGF